MAILNPKNYIWEWERNAFPYYFYIFTKVWQKNKFSLSPVYVVMLYKQGVADCYLQQKLSNKSAKAIINRVVRDPDYFSNWKADTYKTGEQLHQFCDKLSRIDLKKISNEGLLKLLNLSFKTYCLHTRHVVVIRNSNRLLQEIFQRNFNPLNITIILATTQKSFFAKDHEELLKIMEKTKKRKLNYQDKIELLKKHAQKYFYLPCGFYGEKPWTIKDFQKRLMVMISGDETLSKFQAQADQLAVARQRLIRKLNLKPVLKRIVDFGSTCTYFKDFIRANLNRLHYYNILFFKEIARRTGNEWETVAQYLPMEIEVILKNNQKIKPRAKMVLYSDKKGIHIVEGTAAEKIIKNFQKQSLALAATEQIKGTPANGGQASGRVLIVRHIQEANNKKGYILVTPMTTPDLMPAIKRSLAIITDEGGLTCHAAIVARELGKPCIIGTKIATKILHNGDLVEVDAEKGTVKIIKSV